MKYVDESPARRLKMAADLVSQSDLGWSDVEERMGGQRQMVTCLR